MPENNNDTAEQQATANVSHIDKEYPAIGTSDITLALYKQQHAASIADPATFWGDKARQYLDWFVPFTSVLSGDFTAGDITWFAGGKLNVAYNAVDRHVINGRGDQIALIWEGDEPNETETLTFLQLQRRVSQIANALQSRGVTKGSVVTIYMAMTPQLVLTMLACARLGAIHSVVFAGFSSEALASRLVAAQSSFLVTSCYGRRGGKRLLLKEIVNDARTKHGVEDILQTIFVWERNDDDDDTASFELKEKDVRMNALVREQRPYSVPVWMDAEDVLFLLYTSGSTGQPKGLVHTTGGYALYAAHTTRTSFALTADDVFACVADCGWITGHTYVAYGPLLNGFTTFLFESTPVYPNPGRYWDMIQRHRITHFYTAPTAIRLLMRYGDDLPQQYDTSSLKVLGTVGEPINPEAWRWYYQVVGRSRCTIVDTYWQTETGGHVITNLPGVTPMKPGSCTLPLLGIHAVVLDPMSGKEVTEPNKDGVCQGVLALAAPWPGMARTCLGDHSRYLKTYLHVYRGYYFTGDSVIRDADGYYFIIGRVDDVLNVSGHRIGTAEVESALVAHPAVAQAAVVGQPHAIKGQAIAAFVMLVSNYDESPTLLSELKENVRSEIGGFASPDAIVVAPSLPMTRSGKIMRRILRKIVSGEADQLGDVSTLADPSIVEILIEKYASLNKKK